MIIKDTDTNDRRDEMRELVTITNDFHGTEARVRAGAISLRTIQRVRKALCGIDECTCGGNLSERGAQQVEIIPLYRDRYFVEPTTAEMPS